MILSLFRQSIYIDLISYSGQQLSCTTALLLPHVQSVFRLVHHVIQLKQVTRICNNTMFPTMLQ
jgi:hypothetical protein